MADATADNRGVHRDRVRHGVSFKQWAFVLAGLGEGLALEELLAHLRLDETCWEPANAAFEEDVLDDLEGSGTLSDQLDEAMHAARRSWTRPIPPLDVELRAWLDFYRAWAAAEAPMEFLEARGLRATDIHRLQALWSERLAEDDDLRAEAGAILQAPPGPVSTVAPEAPRLGVASALTEAQDVTGPAARGARASLPFNDGEGAPAHPRLSVPLPLSPKLARRMGADETRVAVPAETEGLVLPFLAPEAAVPEPKPSPSVPEPGSDDGERIPLSIDRYAALCVDLIEAPDAHAPTLMRYGITAAEKLSLDVHWTQKMAKDTTTWLAWDRACAERRAGGRGQGEPASG